MIISSLGILSTSAIKIICRCHLFLIKLPLPLSNDVFLQELLLVKRVLKFCLRCLGFSFPGMFSRCRSAIAAVFYRGCLLSFSSAPPLRVSAAARSTRRRRRRRPLAAVQKLSWCQKGSSRRGGGRGRRRRFGGSSSSWVEPGGGRRWRMGRGDNPADRDARLPAPRPGQGETHTRAPATAAGRTRRAVWPSGLIGSQGTARGQGDAPRTGRGGPLQWRGLGSSSEWDSPVR